MKPHVFDMNGERARAWNHNGVLCGVIYRPKFDDYLISVDYSPTQSTIFAPTPTISEAIGIAEKMAESGPQDMKCCADQ